ncbi:MAG: formyltransferase family protein [Rhodanobacter sp.]
MRLILVGQQWLGEQTLRVLIEGGHEVVFVAAPAQGRLATAAVSAGIHTADPGALLPAGWVPEGVDLIVAAHAHCYITAEARKRTRHGAIGYHPSLLPLHRGRDAIRWAIHMREAVTGGTVYWMTNRADAGPIIRQEFCHIQPGDDAAALWRRDLGPMGLRLLAAAVDDVAAGTAARIIQDETLATWEPSFDRPALSSARRT